MNFKIGQVQIAVYELDLINGHVRAYVNVPIAGHELIVSGEFDKLSGKPLYMSVEIDKKGDESHAEESIK